MEPIAQYVGAHDWLSTDASGILLTDSVHGQKNALRVGHLRAIAEFAARAE